MKNSKMPTPMYKLFSRPQILSLSSVDQGIINVFKAQYTREFCNKAFEALKANKETTVMDELLEVSHYTQCDYVGTAWDTKHEPVNCWENVWPGCVENFEGFEGAAERMNNSVKNIMHAAQQISEGFGNMKENVKEILAEKAIDSDDSQPESRTVPLIVAKVTECNSALKTNFH